MAIADIRRTFVPTVIAVVVIPLALLLQEATVKVSTSCTGRSANVVVTEQAAIAEQVIVRESPPDPSPLFLDCGSQGDEPRFWRAVANELELEARSVRAAIAGAEAALRRMEQIDASISGETFRIDGSRAAVFVTYRCGAYSPGGRLFLLRAAGHAWHVTDAIELPALEWSYVVANARDTFVVESAGIMMRADISTRRTVRALDRSWKLLSVRERSE